MTTTMEPATRTFADVWPEVDKIEGWLTPREGRLLWDVATQTPEDCEIIEIGTFRGKSTLLLASSRRAVHAIDPAMDLQWCLQDHRDYHVWLHGIRATEFQHVDAQTIALLYIDGDHEPPAPRKDFLHFEPHLAPNAFVAFHDYGLEAGVTMAVNQMVEEDRLAFYAQAGSMWVGRYTGRKPTERKTRVYLFQPCYGSVKPLSYHAVQNCTIKGQHVAPHVFRDARSLLANDVNRQICQMVADGEWDWFMLCHNDLAPTPHFLTVMLNIADMHGVDVVSAVAAIKDGTGLTSTAIAYTDNRWDRVRKLTMTEVHALPPVFTIDEIREADFDFDGQQPQRLLPNTGCLLVRASILKEKKFEGFSIQDKIDWTDPENPKPPCVPEDWNFGHWCAENGIKLAVTRAVTTKHFGEAVFDSADVWGWERDESFFRKHYAARLVEPRLEVNAD